MTNFYGPVKERIKAGHDRTCPVIAQGRVSDNSDTVTLSKFMSNTVTKKPKERLEKSKEMMKYY